MLAPRREEVGRVAPYLRVDEDDRGGHERQEQTQGQRAQADPQEPLLDVDGLTAVSVVLDVQILASPGVEALLGHPDAEEHEVLHPGAPGKVNQVNQIVLELVQVRDEQRYPHDREGWVHEALEIRHSQGDRPREAEDEDEGSDGVPMVEERVGV